MFQPPSASKKAMTIEGCQKMKTITFLMGIRHGIDRTVSQNSPKYVS